MSYIFVKKDNIDGNYYPIVDMYKKNGDGPVVGIPRWKTPTGYMEAFGGERPKWLEVCVPLNIDDEQLDRLDSRVRMKVWQICWVLDESKWSTRRFIEFANRAIVGNNFAIVLDKEGEPNLKVEHTDLDAIKDPTKYNMLASSSAELIASYKKIAGYAEKHEQDNEDVIGHLAQIQSKLEGGNSLSDKDVALLCELMVA